MDVRKWCAKWRNLYISDVFISFSSIEGRKQQRRPETFAQCMGQCIRREHGKKLFSRFKEDRFDISNTPRSARHSGFDENSLNTLIHVSVLENWQI